MKKRKKYALLAGGLALSLLLTGCSFKDIRKHFLKISNSSNQGSTESKRKNTSCIHTNTLAGWCLYNFNETDYKEYDFTQYDSMIEAAHNNFDGLVNDTEIKDSDLDLYITDKQKEKLIPGLAKINSREKKYLENTDYIEKIELSSDYSNVDIYCHMEAFREDTGQNFEFLKVIYYDSDYIWLCQLENALLVSGSDSIELNLINGSSGYIIGNGTISPDEEKFQGLTLNRYVMNRSYYKDYSEITEISAVYEGSEKATNTEYAKFSASDNSYFCEGEIFYIELSKPKELKVGKEYLLSFDTLSEISILTLDTSEDAALIDSDNIEIY